MSLTKILSAKSPLPLHHSLPQTLAQVILDDPTEGNHEIVTLSDLKIRTKDKRLIPLSPNGVQTYYLDQLHSEYPLFDWRNDQYTLRGVRDDILKARQEGMSTLWLALFFLDTINNPLTQSIIIANDADLSERLFKVIHRFYEGLPAHKKRVKRYSSKREIEFEGIDSGIYVGTAGKGTVGRGGTVNNALLSERAFYDSGGDVEAAVLESVPAEGNIVRETTANGLNEYYQERKRAHAGDSRFTPRFFGWHIHEEYRLPVPAGFERTSEEEKLSAAHGLDDSQLVWRREKMRDLKDKFPQEYPLVEEEAFLASGNPAFNRAYLFTLLNAVTGSSEYAPVREETPDGSAFNATVRTFFEPEPGVEYLIVADPSEGIDGHGNHDYAVAHVYNCSTWEQACHYRGRPDPANFGLDLSVIGTMYNHATIAVLRNNHGHSVLNTLMNQCKYGRSKGSIYHHQVFDQVTKLSSMRPGYPETPRSKPEAVDALTSVIEAMAEGEEGFYWYEPNTIEELIHYVKLGGAKTGNEPGSHDDEVSCCYLAAVLMPQFTKRGLSGANGVRRVDWDQIQPVLPKTANANSLGAVHGLRTMPQPMSKRRRR